MTVGNAVLKITVVQSVDSVDFDVLHKFIHAAFAYMEGRIDPPSSLHRMTPQTLREKSQIETIVLAHLETELVGCMFCRAEVNFLYVGKVAVAPQHQGRGIGKQLFQAAFDLAKRLQFPELELETRIELIENQQSFAKMGFKKTGMNTHEGYDRPTSITMRAKV